MIIHSILFALLLSSGFGLKAQKQKDYFTQFEPSYQLQAGWQSTAFLEAGYANRFVRYKVQSNLIDRKFNLPTDIHELNSNISIGYHFGMKVPAYGLNLGYCYYSSYFLSAGFQTGIQTQNFKQTDLRMTPQLGIHFLGFIHLKYGYSIALFKNSLPQLGRHQISLGITLPFELG